MSEVSIRIVSLDDPAYRQVWDLREAVLRKPIGLSLRDEDLSGERNETTLAAFNTDGKVIGCLMMRPLGNQELKLRQMAVSPEAQGQGIGRLLMNKAEMIAAEARFETITLHARQTAVPFYEKTGYITEGDLFEEVGIPHLFMKKDIHAPLP